MSVLRLLYHPRRRKLLSFISAVLFIAGSLKICRFLIHKHNPIYDSAFPSAIPKISRDWYFVSAYLDHRQYPEAVITIHAVRRADSNDVYFKCTRIYPNDETWEIEVGELAEELEHYDKHLGKGITRTLKIGPFPLKMRFTKPQLQVTLISSYSKSVNQYYPYRELELNLTYIPPLPKIRPKYNFSICIAPAFGFISARRYIEFIEMNRLLGAEHFYIYDFNAAASNPLLKQVWNYYSRHDKENKSIVSVSKWNIPPSYREKDVYYHLQLLHIQHCLYRAIMESRYTMFYDLDEVLVPSDVNTWSQLVKQIHFDGDDQRCSVCFPMAYFKYNSTYNNKYEIMDRSTYFLDTLPTLSHNHIGKCMTRTAYVYEMDVHSTRQCLHDYSHATGSQYGMIHHYYSHYCSKKESFNYDLCQLSDHRNMNILKYEKSFMKHVLHVKQEIGQFQ